MSKNLLVVAASGVSADSAGRIIDRHYGDDVAVHIVATASGLSRLDWLTNAEDDGRADAEQRAQDVADAIPAEPVDAGVGDSDPVQAIEDQLRTFDAEEIVVLTRSDEHVTWLEDGAADAARTRFPVPVTRLVVGD